MQYEVKSSVAATELNGKMENNRNPSLLKKKQKSTNSPNKLC